MFPQVQNATVSQQVAQLSQRDCAAGCVIFGKI